MTEFDKYKACKDLKTGADCPDRIGGCHDDCEGYKARCQKQKEINRKIKASRIAPTEHHRKIVIDFYKRKKKFRNL